MVTIAVDTSIPSEAWEILACASCGARLERVEQGVACPACKQIYPYTESGSLDLRLRRPKTVNQTFEVGSEGSLAAGFPFEPLPFNPQPQVDFSGASIPRHMTRELLSYFPQALSGESLMLDLGCGTGIHKLLGERAGFKWVGLDYSIPQAPILGDGHALPFLSGSFDFVLSIAVLEHIQYPHILMREVWRVLKPGSLFIGTVSFLEPFHDRSFYHHSPLGVFNNLQHGGFEILRIAPSREWTVLKAQARMSLFPKMPQALAHAMVYPLQKFHELWWWFGRRISSLADENARLNKTTGMFTFIARKPATGDEPGPRM
jgi:SAM-dependent methyltransferase